MDIMNFGLDGDTPRERLINTLRTSVPYVLFALAVLATPPTFLYFTLGKEAPFVTLDSYAEVPCVDEYSMLHSGPGTFVQYLDNYSAALTGYPKCTEGYTIDWYKLAESTLTIVGLVAMFSLLAVAVVYLLPVLIERIRNGRSSTITTTYVIDHCKCVDDDGRDCNGEHRSRPVESFMPPTEHASH